MFCGSKPLNHFRHITSLLHETLSIHVAQGLPNQSITQFLRLLLCKDTNLSYLESSVAILASARAYSE